jgi:hypothetical protein
LLEIEHRAQLRMPVECGRDIHDPGGREKDSIILRRTIVSATTTT